MYKDELQDMAGTRKYVVYRLYTTEEPRMSYIGHTGGGIDARYRQHARDSGCRSKALFQTGNTVYYEALCHVNGLRSKAKRCERVYIEYEQRRSDSVCVNCQCPVTTQAERRAQRDAAAAKYRQSEKGKAAKQRWLDAHRDSEKTRRAAKYQLQKELDALSNINVY